MLITIAINFWQPLQFMLRPSILLITAEVRGKFVSLCTEAIFLMR